MLNSHARPLILFVLSLLAWPVLAQNDPLLPSGSLEISGQIRLAQGGVPAERILIRLSRFGGGLVDQTISDSRGNFHFYGMSRGRYILAIENPGYSAEPQQADVDERLVRRAYVFLQLISVNGSTAASLPGRERLLDARVPPQAQKEYERAEIAFKEKKLDRAISSLERAVTIYPEFLAAHILLGASYMSMQQWDKAEGALKRALQIHPKSLTALVDLGEVYRRLKQYAKAEETLQTALKVSDDTWQGHYTLGRIYWETGKVLQAGQHVAHTLQLNPDLAEAHLLAGNIFMRANRPENALVEYEEYLRLAPKGEFAALTRENVEKLKRALTGKKK